LRIDDASQRRDARRGIAIDVVERAAGIESRLLAEPNAVRQRRTEAQSRARGGPVQAPRRQRRQRRGERVGFLAREAREIGIGHIRYRERRLEAAQEERAHARDRHGAIALAQRVVIEAMKNVPFLDRRAKPVEKRVLRSVMHDPVRTRNEELRGRDDRRRIRDDALRHVVQAQQDAHGDRARDQRVAVVARHAGRGRGLETSP
jgi:hypothetical protein